MKDHFFAVLAVSIGIIAGTQVARMFNVQRFLGGA